MKLSRILPLVVGGAVAGVVVSAASPAQALQWTDPTTSTTYDITTITGSFDANSTLITSQPWWGNASNSEDAANTINAGLGLSGWYDYATSQGVSPLFAYNLLDYGDGYIVVGGYLYDGQSGVYDIGLGTGGVVSSNGAVYAVATAATVPFDIPGGATIPTVGSLFALGLMRQAKKRLAAKKLVVNSVETV